MIIHLGGGVRANDYELKYFKTIIDEINHNCGQIVHNWIQSANHKVTSELQKDNEVDWNDAVREKSYAMAKADLYIAETTAYRL